MLIVAMLSRHGLFGIPFISKLLLSGLEKLLFEMGIPATLYANTSEQLTSSIILAFIFRSCKPVVEEFIFRGFIGYRRTLWKSIYDSIRISYFLIVPCQYARRLHIYSRDCFRICCS